MVLADKGFLIQDIFPNDVSLNIPPFLNNGVFTESEAKKTKSIARARIHVERANARLKDFRIFNFHPIVFQMLYPCYFSVTIMIRFSARGTYLLLVPQGRALI